MAGIGQIMLRNGAGSAQPAVGGLIGSIIASLGGNQQTDPYPDFPIVTPGDATEWDKRADGSDKGTGWLGVRSRPDGSVSSELSIGVEINGEEVDIPTMVPGLTPEEMRWLMTTPLEQQAQNMPQTILRKAVAHAMHRMANGKSPFAQEGDR